jgi:hypothetical protein|tara:strand:- start:1440 stop:2030 length:591 start_codon:yes stop_codon:yes gene_type:complete
MKKHGMKLKDYVLRLDQWIPKHWAEKTASELEKKEIWARHTYYNSKTKEFKSLNAEKELDVTWDDDHLTYKQELYHLIWKAIEKYILIEKIGGETFSFWNGFSKIRFNRYRKNQIMSKHVDHIKSLFPGEPKGIPILSILGALNDNYTGGELIMFDKTKIELNAGDVVIFPSNFLYPHLIKPVKKGTRYSFISWCY